MSEGPSTPLVNIGDIAKPVDSFVNRIAEAVTGYCAPWQAKRMANAEADALLIRTRAEVEACDLRRKALERFVGEEARKQLNMDAITAEALPLVNDSARPEDMELDWITYFFERCRITSDSQMQTLWAKILAGEANAPGSYSKRTLRCVAELDKSDALLFTKLCGFVWKFNTEHVAIIWDSCDEIYTENGLKFGDLLHLESIGLITYEPKGFNWGGDSALVIATYYGETFAIDVRRSVDGSVFLLGQVALTLMGKELFPISGALSVEGNVEHTLKHLRNDARIKGIERIVAEQSSTEDG